MDELKGPNIQIILHVKEGLGFGFLRIPFIVSGSLNGYVLETDSVVPIHAPVFDAELVWEADKRRFRSLRVQNVPVKVEVYTTGTQGRKDKVGYLLLSLLSAQPCPANKINDIKYSWHKLLGVRSAGKCCHPQLLMSLSIEDRISTPTPRNELRMFHSNEIAVPSNCNTSNPSGRTILMSLEEYIAESKKTVSSHDLQPILNCEEGLIQVGDGKHLFTLSIIIGSVEHMDMLLPENVTTNKESLDCYISYTVFTHSVMTDRVPVSDGSAMLNQRTSLRLRSDLRNLSRYFAECPHLVTKICAAEVEVGYCSMDLRKLVPTEDLTQFIGQFCNGPNALTIQERCYVLRCHGSDYSKRPYVDVEMSLKYMGLKKEEQKPPIALTRSATHLDSGRPKNEPATLEYKSGSCTDFDRNVAPHAYTNVNVSNTSRFKNAAGDSLLQTNEIADLIRKMYDSFTVSQERILALRQRPSTSDMQVQCEPEKGSDMAEKEEEDGRTRAVGSGENEGDSCRLNNGSKRVLIVSDPIKLDTSRSDTCISHTEKDLVKKALTPRERDEIMQKFVDELEDWKEKQQELYKCQLKRKEEYHLELLAKEWAKKRLELETKLRRGIEQCRTLASDLARTTEDFRLRGYRTADRENKLLEAKKALETHYTAKYQELREASQKLEDDMRHQLKLKDMRIEEQELKVQQLQKQVEVLKKNIKNSEKEAESKYSGLTKDQTASLIQELRCLEEKLDSAVQSKAFFKEQWGRAVRELHLMKLSSRRQVLTQLQHDRKQLGDMGLDSAIDTEQNLTNLSHVDMKRLKDDFYVDILANTPALDTQSMISNTGPEGMDFHEKINTQKNPLNDKLNDLISQRDELIQQDSPDEDSLKQLNHEIRSLLLNCGT